MIKDNCMSIILLLSICIFATVPDAYAISEDTLSWLTGNTYRVDQTDNVLTDKEYTIKVIEFPPPVRGERTIGGGIVPETPVIPFIKFELYKDIINNSNPIGTFLLSEIGDKLISTDQELKITLDSIPSGTSQDWIYEYYNPWAVIKIQRRAIPNLDIAINLKDIDNIDNIDNDNGDTIDPRGNFNIEIKIKNTGEDHLRNVNYIINIDPSLNIVTSVNLKDTVYQLNKDEEKTIELTLTAPAHLEEKEYDIRVNVTGNDIKDIVYKWDASKRIKVRSDIRSISINKQVPRNTTYLKENVRVILNVINGGYARIDNIQINDTIPEKLLFIENNTGYNIKEISFNKTFLDQTSSWTIDYTLKPIEPGVYLLPGFRANFSIRGEKFSMTSGETGFRVFGPKLVLNKLTTSKGNDIIDIKVVAKNIGNGFASKVTIEDQLPNNATLISGKTGLNTSLDENEEKTISYVIKIPDIKDIDSISWPPARAIYYLNDYRFESSSEKIEKITEIISPEIIPKQTVDIPSPQITQIVQKEEEDTKRVVATIPAKTPTTSPKESPGFMVYELLVGLVLVLCLLGKKR